MAERVASIDGLRGALAALVSATYLSSATGETRGSAISLRCVLGFFVVSGYALTRSWRGRFLGFLARRFVRLWPTYALCVAVGGWLIQDPAPEGVYVWFPFVPFERQPRQDPVVWSLYIEVRAMPFMPVLVWFARRPRCWRARVWAAISILGRSSSSAPRSPTASSPRAGWKARPHNGSAASPTASIFRIRW